VGDPFFAAGFSATISFTSSSSSYSALAEFFYFYFFCYFAAVFVTFGSDLALEAAAVAFSFLGGLPLVFGAEAADLVEFAVVFVELAPLTFLPLVDLTSICLISSSISSSSESSSSSTIFFPFLLPRASLNLGPVFFFPFAGDSAFFLPFAVDDFLFVVGDLAEEASLGEGDLRVLLLVVGSSSRSRTGSAFPCDRVLLAGVVSNKLVDLVVVLFPVVLDAGLSLDGVLFLEAFGVVDFLEAGDFVFFGALLVDLVLVAALGGSSFSSIIFSSFLEDLVLRVPVVFEADRVSLFGVEAGGDSFLLFGGLPGDLEGGVFFEDLVVSSDFFAAFEDPLLFLEGALDYAFGGLPLFEEARVEVPISDTLLSTDDASESDAFLFFNIPLKGVGDLLGGSVVFLDPFFEVFTLIFLEGLLSSSSSLSLSSSII